MLSGFSGFWCCCWNPQSVWLLCLFSKSVFPFKIISLLLFIYHFTLACSSVELFLFIFWELGFLDMRIWVFDCFWKTLGGSHFEHWLHSLQSFSLIRCMLGLLTLLSTSQLLFHVLFISLCGLLGNFFTALFQFTDSCCSWLLVCFLTICSVYFSANTFHV